MTFKDEPCIKETTAPPSKPLVKDNSQFKKFGLRNQAKKFQSLKVWENERFTTRLR